MGTFDQARQLHTVSLLEKRQQVSEFLVALLQSLHEDGKRDAKQPTEKKERARQWKRRRFDLSERRPTESKTKPTKKWNQHGRKTGWKGHKSLLMFETIGRPIGRPKKPMLLFLEQASNVKILMTNLLH